jgi:purine-binding chemotaxis protein CheW
MQQAETAGAAAAAGGTQFLTFRLAEEEYAIDILRVQEIKGYSTITPIPNAPAYIRGVMNLRGTVIPVLDLRTKFGMAAEAYSKFTVIIVVTVGTKVIGLVVDAVSDVLNFSAGEIAPPPELEMSIDQTFITGLAKAGDRLIAVLDMDRLVGTQQWSTAA